MLRETSRGSLSARVRWLLLAREERVGSLEELDAAIERAFPGAPARIPGACALPDDAPMPLAAVIELFARSQGEGRKRGGSFFTPPAVARELARRTLAPLAGSKPLVLDPAAGAGALLAAAREVADGELLGVDADPDAVLLARAATGARVIWGDALALEPAGAIAPPLGALEVDAVIGNPPFVASYARGAIDVGEARRELLARRFPTVGAGEANGFLHFLELALELVRPGGRIGLVLPDTLLVNARYERARRALVARTHDLEAAVLDWPAFGAAGVRTALVTATRGEGPRGVRVSVHASERDLRSAAALEVSASELERRPAFAFPRGATDLGLEAKLRERGVPLESVCWVRDGINPGPRAFRERILLRERRGALSFPCLEGRDVSRYAVGQPRLWVEADPALLTPELKKRGASFRESWIFEQEKLVSRQTSPTLVFAREPRGHRALNSVHATGLLPGARLALLAVLAVLNSRVVGWYYARSSGETRRVFPQVHVAALRRLPLPAALLERRDLERELVSLAARLEADPEDRAADRHVDAIVSDLFGLTSAERSVTSG